MLLLPQLLPDLYKNYIKHIFLDVSFKLPEHFFQILKFSENVFMNLEILYHMHHCCMPYWVGTPPGWGKKQLLFCELQAP